MPFLWIHDEIVPVGSTRSASAALSCIVEPQRQRSPNIIGRTSDDVDVLSNNAWQLLLCQITRGCNCRVVCWGLCTGPRLPCQIPSTEFRHRCHGSTWSRSVFAKVMDARLVYWGATLWDGCITLCYSAIAVNQTTNGKARYSIPPYLLLRVLAFCWASRNSGRRLFPVTTAEVRRCQLVHRQASVVRVMFGGSARSETRWECSPIRKAW